MFYLHRDNVPDHLNSIKPAIALRRVQAIQTSRQAQPLSSAFAPTASLCRAEANRRRKMTTMSQAAAQACNPVSVGRIAPLVRSFGRTRSPPIGTAGRDQSAARTGRSCAPRYRAGALPHRGGGPGRGSGSPGSRGAGGSIPGPRDSSGRRERAPRIAESRRRRHRRAARDLSEPEAEAQPIASLARQRERSIPGVQLPAAPDRESRYITCRQQTGSPGHRQCLGEGFTRRRSRRLDMRTVRR